MSTIQKSSGRQYPLVASAVLNIGLDQALNANVPAVITPFNSAVSAATIYDLMLLPPGAQIIEGDINVEVASNDAGAATLSVGDSLNATRYLAATSIKALGRTPLVPTGYRGTGEDIRLTLANGTGGATTGVVTIHVVYVIGNRVQEIQTS